MNTEENFFPYSGMPTNKCKGNNEVLKSPFSHHQNNRFWQINQC